MTPHMSVCPASMTCATFLLASKLVLETADYWYAIPREIPRQRLANRRLGGWQQAAAADDRHRDAGSGEDLSDLGADVSTADDQQGGRQFLKVQRGGAGQVVDGLETGDRRNRGPGTGREDNFRSTQHVANAHALVTHQPALPPQKTQPVAN